MEFTVYIHTVKSEMNINSSTGLCTFSGKDICSFTVQLDHCKFNKTVNNDTVEERGLSAELYPSKTINQVYPAQACQGLSAVCSHNEGSLAKHKPARALMWTSNQFWIF